MSQQRPVRDQVKFLDRTPFTDEELEVLGLEAAAEAVDHLRETFLKCSRDYGLTKAELSSILRKRPSQVGRVLNGKVENLTLKTLGQYYRALGHRMSVTAIPLSQIRSHKNHTIHDHLSESKFGVSVRFEFEPQEDQNGDEGVVSEPESLQQTGDGLHLEFTK